MINDPLTGIEFRAKAVEPIECLKSGWEMIKSQYWLFVGISAVGMLIGSVVPLGILMGPMMCGIYLTLFKHRRGQPIEFGDLFKGFDFFGESIIAALLHMIPMFVILVPTYIIFYVSMFAMMGASGGQPDSGVFLGFFAFFGAIWILVIAVLILISVAFSFAYPLIVDRRLSGLNAVKLSIRAALANFWRLLGLLLLTSLLNFVGVLFCYVGVIFVLPIGFAAISRAYEQVFGLSGEIQPNLPPPPPIFS